MVQGIDALVRPSHAVIGHQSHTHTPQAAQAVKLGNPSDQKEAPARVSAILTGAFPTKEEVVAMETKRPRHQDFQEMGQMTP
jgi:hypothetical protein